MTCPQNFRTSRFMYSTVCLTTPVYKSGRQRYQKKKKKSNKKNRRKSS